MALVTLLYRYVYYCLMSLLKLFHSYEDFTITQFRPMLGVFGHCAERRTKPTVTQYLRICFCVLIPWTRGIIPVPEHLAVEMSRPMVCCKRDSSPDTYKLVNNCFHVIFFISMLQRSTAYCFVLSAILWFCNSACNFNLAITFKLWKSVIWYFIRVFPCLNTFPWASPFFTLWPWPWIMAYFFKTLNLLTTFEHSEL